MKANCCELVRDKKTKILGGVIGLYILIDLEIHIVFINPSKTSKFSNFLGLVFTNPEVFPRI